jgi:hypothetical protein
VNGPNIFFEWDAFQAINTDIAVMEDPKVLSFPFFEAFVAVSRSTLLRLLEDRSSRSRSEAGH